MGDDQNTVPSPEGDAKIGAVLEQARTARGIALEEAEQATKIRKRYLAALESEDFGTLPDAVYVHGFLKTYANYLGLDGEELSRQLKKRRRPRRERSISYSAPRKSEFERPLISPGGLDGTERRKVSGATVLTLIVAVLALAAVIGILYFVGRGAQISGAEENTPPQPAEKAPPPREEEQRSPETRPDNTNGGAGGTTAEEEETAPAETLSVVVSVQNRPSWLSVATDGSVAYEQIAEPGFSTTFEAERQLSITTGDAGAVEVEVNGQDVGPLGGPGEVITRNFTLKNEA